MRGHSGMASKRKTKTSARTARNQRRTRVSFAEMMSGANQRAHEVANRRAGRRALKSVHAAIAATEVELELEHDYQPPGFWQNLPRNLMGLPLLPICWVTWWTLMWQFKGAMGESFWLTPEFWNFAIGAALMIGWFSSGLGETFFLYAYVLGHEVTHAAFVYLCGGKVTDFSVKSTGGYVTTTKTNLLIALSPYFVPFWSVVAVGIMLAVKAAYWAWPEWGELSPHVWRLFYLLLGFTWFFHMAWTFWMIPKDQPDLKENGTFLSLAVIFFGNLLVLTALLCMTRNGPMLDNFESFGRDWLRYATQLSETVFRAFTGLCERAAMEWRI